MDNLESDKNALLKKKNSSEFSKESFFKNINIILKDFHDNLAAKMNSISKQKHLEFLTDFGKTYYSLKDKSEETLKAKILKDNEFLLIPYFQNTLKKLFEIFTKDLESKYNEFLNKTQTSINTQENISQNLKMLLEDQKQRAEILSQDLENIFSAKKEFLMKQQLDPVPDTSESFNQKLKLLFDNQNKINHKISEISSRLGKIENNPSVYFISQ
jgi:hypothetical protein